MTQRWADPERPRRSFAGRLGSAAAAACWAVAVGVVIDVVVAVGELVQPGGILYGLGQLLPGAPFYVFIAISALLGLGAFVLSWFDD